MNENVSQLDQEVNGYEEDQYIAQDLIANKSYNTALSPLPAGVSGDNVGTYCQRVAVSAGEVYRITGIGGNKYVLLWATANSSRSKQRASDVSADARTTPVELTIAEGEAYLYVNLSSYNSETDKIEKVVTVEVPGIAAKVSTLETEVEDLKEDVLELNADLNGEYRNSVNAGGGVSVLEHTIEQGDRITSVENFSGSNFILYEDAEDETGRNVYISHFPFISDKSYTRVRIYQSGTPRVTIVARREEATNTRLDSIDDEMLILESQVTGEWVHNPTIQSGKLISGGDGTISASGATNVYTEIIPDNCTKITTRFNSHTNPSNCGYAFYDANDNLVSFGNTLAGNDPKKNGLWLELAVPARAKKFSNTVAWQTAYNFVKFDYEGIRTIAELPQRIDEVEAKVNSLSLSYTPEFTLPKAIPLLVNEECLLFKSAFGNYINPADIHISGEVRDFPRYLKILPTREGTFQLQIEHFAPIHAEDATVALKVFSAPENPETQVNILMVGSSTTSNYKEQYEELYRRLVLTTGQEGDASNPKGLGLSNVNFVGRKANNSGNFRYEATGGFSWGQYYNTQTQDNNYAFTVADPSAYNIGDVYTDGTYDFEITEISQNDNRVSAKCATQNAPISASGTLSLKTGSGPASFVYSAVNATISRPFDLGNGISLSDYMDAYCDGASVDIVVFQDLVFNSGGVLTSANKTGIKSLFDIIHSEYPNARILMSSEELPSATGGLASNYVARTDYGKCLQMTNRLRSLVTDTIAFIDEVNEEYGDEVVIFVPKAIECDCEYDYPVAQKDVNLRVTTKEDIGTNGMHPTATGILNQIDSYYRSIADCIKRFF